MRLQSHKTLTDCQVGDRYRLVYETIERSQSLIRDLKQIKNINADNIDAEYEALCAEYSFVTL